MSDTRQKTRPEQLGLAFAPADRSEAPEAGAEGTEPLTAKRAYESPPIPWKTGRRRFAELRTRGVGANSAAMTAGSTHGPWYLANSYALARALPSAYFASLGLPRLVVQTSA
jgi:hypothetical protein